VSEQRAIQPSETELAPPFGPNDEQLPKLQHGIQVIVQKVWCAERYTSWAEELFVTAFHLEIVSYRSDEVHATYRAWRIHEKKEGSIPSFVRQGSVGGEQPPISAEKSYEYTSAVSLPVPEGAWLAGEITFLTAEGDEFVYQLGFNFPTTPRSTVPGELDFKLDGTNPLTSSERARLRAELASLPGDKENPRPEISTAELGLSMEGREFFERSILNLRKGSISADRFDFSNIIDLDASNNVILRCNNALLKSPNYTDDDFRFLFQECWAEGGLVPDETKDLKAAAQELAKRLRPVVEKIAKDSGATLTDAVGAVMAELSPRLPDEMPQWPTDRIEQETPIEFLERVWGPHIAAGTAYQDDVRARDPKLVPAIHSFCQRKKIAPSTVLPPPRQVRTAKMAQAPEGSPEHQVARTRLATRARTQRSRERLAPM